MDNTALHDQLEVVYGQTPTIPIPGVPRSRFRDVPSLSSWLYCFLAYAAIRTTDGFTRNMLTYARLITREALRHGGSGWQDYDRNFRRQVEIDPTLPWNTLLPDLQSTTILGHRSGGGTFCVLCRGVDHVASQCALQWLQNPSTTLSIPVTPFSRRQQRTVRSLSAQQVRICTSWNMGSCTNPGTCTYRHICRTCQLSHRAKDCPDTPEDSIFRRGGQPMGQNISTRPNPADN